MVHLGFEDYANKVSKSLNINFSPNNPYKICDIRPAFGVIHEDDIKGYDFWAFGDLDLIFGDFRAFFSEFFLEGRDLISTHERRVSGHCCLVRNNERMNNAFRMIPDWAKRFCNQQHEALDEGAFSRIFIRHKNWPSWLYRIASKFNPWYRRALFVEAYSTPDAKVAWVDGSRNFPKRWFWREGVLTNDRDGERSFPYVHFLVWKGREWKQLPESTFVEYSCIAQQPAWQVSARGFELLNA